MTQVAVTVTGSLELTVSILSAHDDDSNSSLVLLDFCLCRICSLKSTALEIKIHKLIFFWFSVVLTQNIFSP